MEQKYSDTEIAAFAEFAEAVCEAGTKQAQYGATWPTAYWQYYVEVVSNVSGMRDNPRAFFESDLKMRQEWGDHIIKDYQKYVTEVEAEEAAKTEEPENVKALREELEAIKAELAKLTALKEAEAKTEDEPQAEPEAEPAEVEAEDEDDEEEAEEEAAEQEA